MNTTYEITINSISYTVEDNADDIGQCAAHHARRICKLGELDWKSADVRVIVRADGRVYTKQPAFLTLRRE
jgi:hypothetical protein